MIVPMAARGRVLGAMTFATTGAGRRYGQADLEMAQHLARRSALAVENARLYAEAQRAIRARDDVLAIVSHDLRNPLHAIGMASNLLARPGAPPSRVRAHAAAIERATRRMGRLIRDLLDSSRLETGRLVLERQAAQVGVLLAEAVAILAPLAAEKPITLVLASAAEGLEVYCDRERLLQVLSNLIGNALAFTAAGGTVTISAEADGAYVRFSVQDTGVGIPVEHQRRIFDRYWRSRESRQGTGLGLAIAKGIVEAHGGRIWVESSPGEGATFRFTLPRTAATPAYTPVPVPGR
jgi:signal transduction histidine kinase